jgi:hypothetical protein
MEQWKHTKEVTSNVSGPVQEGIDREFVGTARLTMATI